MSDVSIVLAESLSAACFLACSRYLLAPASSAVAEPHQRRRATQVAKVSIDPLRIIVMFPHDRETAALPAVVGR
ncbi:MAG: hypothetical protein QM775_27200 [Pirellulales bacterium]